MQHQPSTIQIYFSKDYKQFKFIKGNRHINEAKVKKIIRDIDNGLDMLRYCPIVVNNKMEIIDGQHRYTVCKILKCPVHYVIAGEAELHEIAKINSRTERWKPIDFVRCYMETGNTQYEILMRFMLDYQLPASSAMMILSAGIHNTEIQSQRLQREFEEGRFVVTALEEAETIMQWACQFDEFEGRTSRTFLKAISIILRHEKCDMEDLLHRYRQNPSALSTEGSHKKYLTALEDIYNRSRQKRQTIY